MSLLNYFTMKNIKSKEVSDSVDIRLSSSTSVRYASSQEEITSIKLQSDLNNDTPMQPRLKEYAPKPYNEKGKEKMRDFKYSWFVRFTWLEYSIEIKAAFCFPCRVFHTSDKNCFQYDPTFVKSGFSNWKTALEKGRGLIKHDESIMHKRNMIHWLERQKRVTTGTSVSTLLCEEQMNKNRYYIGSLIDILQFIAINELPLRGDINERFEDLIENGSCDGLFLRLFQYTIKKDPKLAEIMSTIPKNASYTSPEIQNELLMEMSAMVVEQIVDNVKHADVSFYTIKADGTRDKAWKENFSLVLRFVKNGKVYENLVAILDAKELHAEYLSNLILSTLDQLGLDANKMLSQCYDGASVMAGCHGGVQALIQRKLGKTVPYTHCFNHQLHLVVVHTVSREPQVKSMFDTCDCLYNFVRKPNVAAVYKGHRLRRLLEQRWSGHLSQLQIVTMDFDDIISLLEYFNDSDECSTDVCIEAAGLLVQIKKPMFRFIACFMKQILLFLSPANQLLQAEACDLLSALSLISASKESVMGLRKEESFDQFLKDARITLDDSNELNGDTTYPLPRKRLIQSSSNCGQRNSSPLKLQLKQMFYSVIDNVLGEMDSRFNERHWKITKAISCLVTSGGMAVDNLSTLEPLCTLIGLDIHSDAFKAEMVVACNMIFHGERFDKEKLCSQFPLHYICETLSPMKDILPNVYSMYASALTFGGSSSSCEASFSTLTRIMTPYRRTMNHTRKANLVILAFEHQLTEALDKVSVMKRFSQKSRRIVLF